jgi:predicted RNase H-like HicB family nuclease
MRNSSKKHAVKKNLPIDRPFDPKVLEKARRLAAQYRIVLEQDPDEGFVGTALELPLCIGTGKTPDACVEDTREILVSAIATMLEDGQTPPAPSSEKLRQEQINIRVTSEEKLLLETAAQSRGFRGISDFIRSTTLAAVR